MAVKIRKALGLVTNTALYREGLRLFRLNLSCKCVLSNSPSSGFCPKMMEVRSSATMWLEMPLMIAIGLSLLAISAVVMGLSLKRFNASSRSCRLSNSILYLLCETGATLAGAYLVPLKETSCLFVEGFLAVGDWRGGGDDDGGSGGGEGPRRLSWTLEG
ncbi:unnamed protein product [Euphydryas editha]|uniref:Uncharacterized protein n=1 Tax=Euphydryas editha TaxID=104508 RepID=A0AAU9UQ20_EUPED|nr:unnamed protein product [Euphydryas editha]